MKSEYAERFRNLGLQIARYRKQKGLTQMDLAKKQESAAHI